MKAACGSRTLAPPLCVFRTAPGRTTLIALSGELAFDITHDSVRDPYRADATCLQRAFPPLYLGFERFVFIMMTAVEIVGEGGRDG
jgi:hypothetical protein